MLICFQHILVSTCCNTGVLFFWLTLAWLFFFCLNLIWKRLFRVKMSHSKSWFTFKLFHYFPFLLSKVARADPFYKPVPQPRSKTLERPAHLDKTHKEKVSQRHRTPFADLRSDTLNSLENLQYVSGNRSPDESRFKATSPLSTDSLSQGDSEDGNSESHPPKHRGSVAWDPLAVEHHLMSLTVCCSLSDCHLEMINYSSHSLTDYLP